MSATAFGMSAVVAGCVCGAIYAARTGQIGLFAFTLFAGGLLAMTMVYQP